MSPGPSGTYYGSLVVINHRRVSTSTQCLPRVSNSHSLTVSSTIAFLSICPLLPVAPTWALRNWSFSCWHVWFFFFFFLSVFSRRCVFPFLSVFLPRIEEREMEKRLGGAEIKHGEDLTLTFHQRSHSPYFLTRYWQGLVVSWKSLLLPVWRCEQDRLLDKHAARNCIHLSWVLTSCGRSGVVTVWGWLCELKSSERAAG